jgi:drug/metabolite transporter (DMT)-like permease
MIVYVVWGSTYLAIRVTVETLPPFLSAGLRFATAGLILAGTVALRGGPRRLRVTWRQASAATLVGVLLLVIGNGGVVLAEDGPPGRAVPSGVAALLIALVPLLVVLFRTAHGDRPPVATLVGVLVGFAGLAALVASRGGTAGSGGTAGGGAGTGGGGVIPIGGVLIVLVAAVSWAAGSYYSQRLPLPRDPFVATVYEMLGGGVVLLLTGLARRERIDVAHVSTRSWVALAYLLVVGSLGAFTAYVWLLRHAPISLTSTYAYVNPVVAVALGALVVAEPVTLAIVLCGVIILAGVALVVSTERPPPRAPAPAPDATQISRS